MRKLVIALGALLALAGCSSTGNGIDVKTAFQDACAYMTTADQAFKAAAPALKAAGKLGDAQIKQEAGIWATAQVTCASPPADLQIAAVQLVGDAAAIYLIISSPPPEPAFLTGSQKSMALGQTAYRLGL